MQIRDVVKRVSHYDYQAIGPAREVVNIADLDVLSEKEQKAHSHMSPKNAVVYLDDGSWEFAWNLTIVAHPKREE